MAQLDNSLEGLTDGTTITTGNSGGTSGTAFSIVNIDATCSVEGDTAFAAHGTVSARLVTPAGGGSAYVSWTSGISGTTTWARAYYRIPTTPAANTNVLRMLDSASTISGYVRFNSTGKWAILSSVGSVLATGTTSIPTGAYFRLELQVTAGTTTGSVIARLFLTPDSTTATEILTATNVNGGANPPIRLRAGIMGAAGALDWNIDDISFSDVGWIGPVSAGGGSATSADTLTLADAAARTLTVSRTGADTVALADAAGRASSRARTAADTLTVADGAAATGTQARTATGALSLTDGATATVALARTSADSRALTDAGVTNGVSRSATATDTITLADSAGRGPTTSSRVAADTLHLADAAGRTTAVSRSGTDTVTLADHATPATGVARGAADALALADTVSRTVTASRASADTIGLADGADEHRLLNRSAADALHLADTAASTAPPPPAPVPDLSGSARVLNGIDGTAVRMFELTGLAHVI